MALTPLDIQNKEFRKSFRGYSEEEVDSFLDKIIQEYERLYQENQYLKEKMTQLNDGLGKYRELEETLRNTLVLAQQTSEEVRANAAKEAELVYREAKAKAEEMINTADRKVQDIYREFEEIQKQSRAFRAQIRALLQSQLEIIEGDEKASLKIAQ
ncbi:MAG: DivIVA domain-containing protein [Bacillota bacterium]